MKQSLFQSTTERAAAYRDHPGSRAVAANAKARVIEDQISTCSDGLNQATADQQPGAGGYLAPPASAPEPTPAPGADAIIAGRGA